MRRALALSSTRRIRGTRVPFHPFGVGIDRRARHVRARVRGMLPRVSSPPLTITVLGTGTMGQGIAQVTATSGFPTRVYDIAPERVQQALKAIEAQLEKLVHKGKIDLEAKNRAIALLEPA